MAHFEQPVMACSTYCKLTRDVKQLPSAFDFYGLLEGRRVVPQDSQLLRRPGPEDQAQKWFATDRRNS